MENGHIVLQECEYGIHKQSIDNVEKKVLINRCGKRTAEDYLVGSYYSPLIQQIERTYAVFVEMEHKVPLKPYYTGEKE
jgi:hypothetical protein